MDTGAVRSKHHRVCDDHKHRTSPKCPRTTKKEELAQKHEIIDTPRMINDSSCGCIQRHIRPNLTKYFATPHQNNNYDTHLLQLYLATHHTYRTQALSQNDASKSPPARFTCCYA